MTALAQRLAAFAVLLLLAPALCVAAEVEQEQPSLAPRAYSKAVKHESDRAHGIIMGCAVIICFPFGAMSWKLLNRFFNARTLLLIHICVQTFGFLLLMTGFGIGIWVAITHAEVYNDALGHAVLGTIIVGLFLLQPLIGIWHHKLFKASKTNQLIRQGHIWLGRLLIILTFINGGLGIDLGNNSVGGEKAWGTLAGILGVVYIILVVVSSITKKSNTDEKGSDAVTNEVTEEKGIGKVKSTVEQV